MEESSSEEELPLLRSQASFHLTAPSSPSAEALAEISIERAKEQRKQQLRNIISLCGITLLLGIGVPSQYTTNEVLFTDPVDIRETVFIIHASLLGSFVLGGLLLTPLLIAYLGLTYLLLYVSVSVCIYLYLCYIPSLVTLVPSGIAVGQALQSSHVSYLIVVAQISHLYLNTHVVSEGQTRQNILHFFSGLFHTFFLAGPVFRSLIEIVFLQKETNEDKLLDLNDTMICTKLDCSWKADEVLLRGIEYFDMMLPTFNLHRLQALLGLISILVVGALFILTLCFKIPFRTEGENVCRTMGLFVRSSWKVCGTDFLLLVPTMLFIGMEETVVYQVIAKNYLSCRHGWTDKEFFILCVSGIATVTCFPLAVLASYVGRVKSIIAVHLVFVALLFTLCIWTPDWGDRPVIFGIGSLWGAASALLRVQVPLMLEKVFLHHCISASSLCVCAMGLGMLSMVLLQHFMCTQVSFTACLSVAVISTVTYVVYEIRQALLAKNVLTGHKKSELTLPDLDHPSWLPGLDPHETRDRISLFGRP